MYYNNYVAGFYICLLRINLININFNTRNCKPKEVKHLLDSKRLKFEKKINKIKLRSQVILPIGTMAIAKMVISQLFSIKIPTTTEPTTAPQRHHIKLIHSALARKYVGTNSRSAPPKRLMTTPGSAMNNMKLNSCTSRCVTKIKKNPQEDEMRSAAINIALRCIKKSINQQTLYRII